ncbi:MAG: carboxypeptidase regulatory-like domain-containing protein [Candidatus Omnitrophica bacterium]|nr:carboxypeptidase regulatory-like domain-containing protein [Candidatus Omnitrophota bacterium]
MNKKLFAAFVVSIFFTALVSSGLAQEGGAAIMGKVLYKGEPIVPKPINFGAEKQCATMHGDKMPVNEDVVINPNGTVKWAFVFIKEEVPGDYPVPQEPLVIDQQGCVFIPHVAAVRAGQSVEFLNSDPVLHNVRSLSKEGQSFNVAQPIKGMKSKKTFSKAEVAVPLKCDVHFWMQSYLHIMPHPFYAVTGEDGSYSIQGLPPGIYTLELWHEKLGSRSKTVTITEGQAQTVDFELGNE